MSRLFAGILLVSIFTAKIIAATFNDLGDLSGAEARSVSSNGAVVVGMSDGYKAFRWTQADGIQILGVLPGRTNSWAFGVSGDGAVVAGSSSGSATLVQRAFRWSQSNGIQSIGTFDGGTDSDSISFAEGVSEDGEYLIGSAQDKTNISYRAFRWTQTGGMQNLGNFSGSPYWYHSYARGISADGSVVVGNAWYTNSKSRAFRWTQNSGMQDLGSFGTNDESFALAVSADGSVVVGYNRTAPNSYGRAFRWTQAGGMQDLGVLPNGEWSQAYSTSADGSIVVGSCGFSTGPAKAFIWSQGTGMVDLGAYLSSLLPETAGFNFTYCYDVSSDGNTLVGMGNKSGNRAFVVTDIGVPLSTSVNIPQYGTVNPGGFKIVGSVQTVEAIPNAGYVFTGWSGDASGSLNPISVTMNSSKTIIANFAQDLSDNDADGLSNHDEIIIHNSDPNQADSNLDGFTDSQAVGLGYPPNFNFGPLLGYLRTNVPSANSLGLYTTNQIHAMAIGDLVLTRTNGDQFVLNYGIVQSEDLQTWAPYQRLSLSLTNLPTNKAFIRLRIGNDSGIPWWR